MKRHSVVGLFGGLVGGGLLLCCWRRPAYLLPMPGRRAPRYPRSPLLCRVPQLTVVQLRFDGVDDTQRVVNAERLPGKIDYLIGNDPARWLTDLPTYAGIVYEQLTRALTCATTARRAH